MIHGAVDATSGGDTIIVYPSTYTENVDVNKSLTIQTLEKFDQNASQSESGAAATIVQVTNWQDIHVFYVTASYENISGFTVEEKTTFIRRYILDIISKQQLSNKREEEVKWGELLKT